MAVLNALLPILLISSAIYASSSNLLEAISIAADLPDMDLLPNKDPGPGKPLFLTPYIENNDIQKARSLSKVGKLPNATKNSILSYSGLFTVNKKYNSNMFFWFFPPLNNNTKAPIILWLQGGPGTSSLLGVFAQISPYIVRKNLTVDLRSEAWNNEFSVLFVDNPVGAGFSFTDDNAGYSKNDDQVADNLYEFLRQFFQVFYEYGTNDLYVSGQSYGGKFAPDIAYKIHVAGPPAQIKLRGVSIGNGFCDPINQLNFSDYYYELGIMDRKQAKVIRNVSETAAEDIRNGNFNESHFLFNNIVQVTPAQANPPYLLQFSGYVYGSNLLQTTLPEDLFYFQSYIQFPEFRKAVHVGNLTFNDVSKVQDNLYEDFMKSVRPKLVTLMNNYKVIIYNGLIDLITPYPLMTDLLRSLTPAEWKSSNEYKKADQQIWRVNGTVAGYVHNVGDFYQIGVRSAGHLVPYDQPVNGLDLITRFIKGEPYA